MPVIDIGGLVLVLRVGVAARRVGASRRLQARMMVPVEGRGSRRRRPRLTVQGTQLTVDRIVGFVSGERIERFRAEISQDAVDGRDLKREERENAALLRADGRAIDVHSGCSRDCRCLR